jgi:hypothetical protein
MFGLSQLFALQSFYAILTVHLFFIISLHLTRSDKTFLAQTPLPHALIFIVEYAILSLPFLAYFLVYQAFVPLFAVLICIFLLGFVKFHIKTKPLQSVSFAWIPAHIFEWRAGLRVSWVFLLLMYLLAVVFYAHETVLILCWVLLIIFFSTFYLQAEGRVLLQLSQLPARTFLFKKAKDYLILSFLFSKPNLYTILYQSYTTLAGRHYFDATFPVPAFFCSISKICQLASPHFFASQYAFASPFFSEFCPAFFTSRRYFFACEGLPQGN